MEETKKADVLEWEAKKDFLEAEINDIRNERDFLLDLMKNRRAMYDELKEKCKRYKQERDTLRDMLEAAGIEKENLNPTCKQ